MTGYDVIGDVHGHADRLESLLRQLDYDCVADVWRHPDNRTAAFVGDLIDRGRDQLSVLRIVRSMVDAGTAHMVMGNHEFNAIAYATVDPKRLDYCRAHSEKNNDQHSEFLADVAFGTPLHAEIILGSARSRCGSTAMVCVSSTPVGAQRTWTISAGC